MTSFTTASHLVLVKFCVLLLAHFVYFSSAKPDVLSDHIKDNKFSTINTTKSSPRELITLAESFQKSRLSYQNPELDEVRKQYWKRTLSEIRNLTSGTAFFPHRAKSGPKTTRNQRVNGVNGVNGATGVNGINQDTNADTTNGNLYKTNLEAESKSHSVAEIGVVGSAFFNQWKMFLDERSNALSTESRKRFDGFLSWERLLQDWADDIQEYMIKHHDEQRTDNATYANSQAIRKPDMVLQRPASTSSFETTIFMNDTETVSLISSAVEPSSKEQSATILPIPAPAKPGEKVLAHTDISDKSKRIWIVTTASLPWRTGTAVNALLRAAYLTKGRAEAGGSVTLMLPWLERKEDQIRLYGDSLFENEEDQEQFIRTWLRDSANMVQASETLQIKWYTAWHNKPENSIYSMGDITALIPDDAVDICILEEPEHLNWYRAPGESWTKKFKHVVGILHTNYFQYAMDAPAALIRAPALKLLCSWMCRAHCHRVIKLSGTLGKFAPEKELVENVHGVRGTFIDIGTKLRTKLESKDAKTDPVFGPTAKPTIYFIGKMMWTKGLGSLMELLKYAEETAELRVKVDMYGSGPEQKAAETRAKKLNLDMPFHGPLDHAELGDTHKIFINPSTSEVLCTTCAEALAMGKFVIVPSHPSNDFFAQFPNCLVYTTKEEFVGNLYYAMTHSPEPLTQEFAYALSWEAATERLAAAACIPVAEAEQFEQAHVTSQASIEITLPPLVEAEEKRNALATTLHYTRERYRQFRSKLSNEIQQSKVLPKFLRDLLTNELEKRLDLDFEEMLSSPKLRLKLSPAELDKTLLDLYDNISESASGDLLRLIGGAGAIGWQNFYMRQKAQKQLNRRGIMPSLLPSLPMEFERKGVHKTATQRVRWAMQKNLPKTNDMTDMAHFQPVDVVQAKEETMQMSLSSRPGPSFQPQFKSSSSFVLRRPLTLSILI